MKRSFLFCIYLALACQVAAQVVVKDKAYYLQRSKNQKTAGFILLGGGAALLATGLLTGNKSESSFDDASTGAIVGGAGVLAMAGSIPLFIAAKRNQQKAMTLGTTFYQHTDGIFFFKIPVCLTLLVKL